jgi:hypothetical protein
VQTRLWHTVGLRLTTDALDGIYPIRQASSVACAVKPLTAKQLALSVPGRLVLRYRNDLDDF